MVYSDHTSFRISIRTDESNSGNVITAILRARQVLQPFDFPATPTMVYRCKKGTIGSIFVVIKMLLLESP